MDDAYFFNVLYSPQIQADGVQIWTKDYVRAAMYNNDRTVPQAPRQTAYSLSLDAHGPVHRLAPLTPQPTSPSRLQGLEPSEDRPSRRAVTCGEAIRLGTAPTQPGAACVDDGSGEEALPRQGRPEPGGGSSTLRLVQGVLVVLVLSSLVVAVTVAVQAAHKPAENCASAEQPPGRWPAWLRFGQRGKPQCEGNLKRGVWGWARLLWGRVRAGQ